MLTVCGRNKIAACHGPGWLLLTVLAMSGFGVASIVPDLVGLGRRAWAQTTALAAGTEVHTPVAALGAVYSQDATTFSIWSPDKTDVKLWLDGQLYPMARVPDTDEYSDVYTVTVRGDHNLKKYNFRINGNTVRDPYGVMVEPATDNNIVMDMSRIEPEGGWVPAPALAEREDAVIYEVDIRDFTIDPNSGVSPEQRGKFLGMVQHGTTYQGRHTSIDHLVDLGVTHVQIMPMFDFRSCSALAPGGNPPGCYNWGYDPENYNVPEENYSQFPTDYVARVRELQTMVNEFHRAGLRVIMDVVYNHVPVDANGRDRVFGGITDQYFLAHDVSGAGRSLNGGVPMVSRMIRDSLEHWVRDYHIDGFRFDLMGVFRYLNADDWAGYLNARYPDRNLLIYGEPWAASGGDIAEGDLVRLGTVARIASAHVGVFNGQYRDAIRGSDMNGGGDGGYMFNQGDPANQIQPGSRGSIRYNNDPYQSIDTWDRMFGASPAQSINYISAHDNLCLRDRILAWARAHGRANDAAYLARIQEFGTGIVLTSQGIPFMSEGDEFLRDKQGDHNSYQSPDSVNMVRWDLRVQNDDVYSYFRSTIALRRAHPAFRMTSWTAVNQNITTTVPRNGVVVNLIKGAANGDPWGDTIVIYNSADNYEYTLPAGPWQVAMEKSAPVEHERTVTGTIVAEGTAVTVLHR